MNGYRLPPDPEMEKTKKDENRRMKVNFITIIVVFLVAFIFMPRQDVTGLVTWGDKSLELSWEETTYTVDFQDIAAMDLVENMDIGTMVNGTQDKKLQFGVWENGAWGRYKLCAYGQTDLMIRIKTVDNDTICLSYESANTTREMYQSMVENLQNDGYNMGK